MNLFNYENVSVSDITRTIKKKQKRLRTAFSAEQLRALERTYSRHRYIDSEKRAELAKFLNIGDKCIKIWFQNRRMKEKKESLESSCDSSNESVGNEPPLEPESPPLQVKPEESPSEHINQFTQYHNPGYDYQLPTYYGTHQIPSGYRSMQPSYATYFYNDTNVYPTQYYPFGVNNSNNDGNGFNQYSDEISNCWSSNHYPYYTNI